MQQVLKVNFGGEAETSDMEKLNALLKEGWKVVDMESFSEVVSAYPTETQGRGRRFDSNVKSGAYGMVFILDNGKE